MVMFFSEKCGGSGRALLFVAWWGVVGNSGCAPAAPVVDERFVARPELSAVAMAAEGASDASRGRFREAELNFRRALFIAPEADNVRHHLGRALLRSGDGEAAEIEYRYLLSKRPAAVFSQELAAALLLQERYEEAIEIYELLYLRAVAQGDVSGQHDLALALADVFFRLGRGDEANCWSGKGARLG